MYFKKLNKIFRGGRGGMKLGRWGDTSLLTQGWGTWGDVVVVVMSMQGRVVSQPSSLPCPSSCPSPSSHSSLSCRCRAGWWWWWWWCCHHCRRLAPHCACPPHCPPCHCHCCVNAGQGGSGGGVTIVLVTLVLVLIIAIAVALAMGVTSSSSS